MKKICCALIGLGMLLSTGAPVAAQVSFSIGLPRVNIGINLPLFPDLVQVPGYPVYYAPGVAGNYFFYDGNYWVFQDDNWYASSWYNGPWEFVAPDDVPLFILRVPVRYYRVHPLYFRGWLSDAPPRWGHHWGREWEHRRQGWDRWERRSVFVPAPLPLYQRKYSGARYPRHEHQQELQRKNYRYEPREKPLSRRSQERINSALVPDQQEGKNGPGDGIRRLHEAPAAPGVPTSQQGDERAQRTAPAHLPQAQRAQAREQRRQQSAARPAQQSPAAQGHNQKLPTAEDGIKNQKLTRGRDKSKDQDEERFRPQNR